MATQDESSALNPETSAAVTASFRQSDIALVMLDDQSQVMTVSIGAEALFGCTQQDLVGASLGQWFSDPEALSNLVAGPANQPRRKAQLEARRASGEVLSVEVQCNQFAVDGGSDSPPLSMLLIYDTHSRQHEDEQRAARLAKLSLLNQVSEALYGAQLDLDQILQAVLVCMTAGQGLRFNRAFLLLVDTKTESLQGEMAIGPSNADEAARIWHDLAHQPSDLFEMVLSYDKSIKQTDVAVNEIVRHMSIPLNDEGNILIQTMAEGHVRAVGAELDQGGVETLRHWLGCHEFAIAPMSTRRGPVGVIVVDNAISGTAITALDLEFLQMFANQTAGAIENSRLYSELEQRLNDLHVAHDKQREDQETLLRMERLSVMGETSAIVAHELRNPLVAIGGFARSLTRGIEPGDPNRVAATIIVEEVSRMERIIHDLLDFIRPPKLLRQALVVDETVTQSVEKYRPRVEEAKVELIVDLQAGPLVAEMHPGEIQQVLQNFLLNAIQALDGPGQVVVRSRGIDGGVKVSVADNGPGIDPTLVEKLDAPFFSTKPTGSGLGLTICTQIIKAHGGVFEVENQPEGGAVFSFILPRHKPADRV